MRAFLIKKIFFVVLFLFVFSTKMMGQAVTSGAAYIWSTATTWTPAVVPVNTTNVAVNHPLTLDQDLTITTGNYTFNHDITDQPGGTNYNFSTISAVGSLTVASGTTTIGGITSIEGGASNFILTVKSGATLILGTVGSVSDNFLIGNKVTINIEFGGSLIVYGNIVNSNSSGSVTVNGLLQVFGNYSTNNGNIDISGATGQFYTTGSMSTQGSSDIYGSGNECVSNCSGTSLGCGSGGNSYTAIVTPQSQTVCSGGAISTMTFTTNAPSPTYQWQYSMTAGGTFTSISGETLDTYTPASLTATRWYRVKYTSSACSGDQYSAPVPVYVSASTYRQSTAGQTLCGGSFGPISVSAFGTALTYQWYTNTSAVNSGGTPITGAVSNIYTPSSTTSGTNYYYCVINSSCGTPFTTAVSGAFTISVNSVTAASLSPTPCINTVMANITHTTTGATGIGSATGLPTGVSALWSSGTITISGTPTQSGTFNYSIPLTGGCGNLNATGTITVNPVPVITTQPVNQLDCEGSFVNFKVVASGTGLTYVWQYKRPADAGFITLTGSETNTTYPAAGEIRIGNVSSAQYPNGTQFQVIVSNGNCSVTSAVATLTVNEITNITGGTNVTQCFGTNYSYTVTTSNPANVVSYRWKKSVTSGVWDEISDGGAYSGAITPTLTITAGTPTESAEYRVYITFKSSGADCNVTSTTRTRKITFLPLLTTPLTTIIQPTCISNTGTITVTIQSASDTYSFDNGFSFQASNVKSGLATGNYNVIIKNVADCISPTTTCVIISDTSIWDGTTWLNGTPDASRGIVFQQNYTSTADIDACSCEVTNGANVVINSAHTLKVTNAVTVVSGSLTFENNASLVQINDAAINSGNINYKRYTAPVRRYDFTYWSSPVAGQTLKNLSPNTLGDKYYGYNSIAGAWVIYYNGAAIMQPGNGYLIRAPQTFSITSATIDTNPVFSGVPNNGIVSLPITASKTYLLGNPYASAINADTFLDTNAAVLEGTLYFWTHNSPPDSAVAGDAIYNYTSDDYATYNRTGGVGTRISTADPAYPGGIIPTGKIAAGQGFFAPASTAGGNLVFNNGMRVSGGASGINNSQFFKMNTASKVVTTTVTAEKSRIWLNLTNNQGAFKQTLIGYLTGATNNYDAGYDGVTYDGNQYVDFYSVNQQLHLTIQGRALPFEKQDTVALGYKSAIKGEFQISLEHTDGLLDFQQVFLEDKELDLQYDLKKEPYSFTTEKGTFNNRFVLRYETKNEAGKIMAKEPIAEGFNFVSVFNKEIKLSSSEGLISKISLYNVSGKLVYQKEGLTTNHFVIQNLNLAHQVVLVNVILDNGQTFVRKIIY